MHAECACSALTTLHVSSSLLLSFALSLSLAGTVWIVHLYMHVCVLSRPNLLLDMQQTCKDGLLGAPTLSTERSLLCFSISVPLLFTACFPIYVVFPLSDNHGSREAWIYQRSCTYTYMHLYVHTYTHTIYDSEHIHTNECAYICT